MYVSSVTKKYGIFLMMCLISHNVQYVAAVWHVTVCDQSKFLKLF